MFIDIHKSEQKNSFIIHWSAFSLSQCCVYPFPTSTGFIDQILPVESCRTWVRLVFSCLLSCGAHIVHLNTIFGERVAQLQKQKRGKYYIETSTMRQFKRTKVQLFALLVNLICSYSVNNFTQMPTNDTSIVFGYNVT